MRRGRLVLFGVLSLGCALPSLAQDSGVSPEKKLAGLAQAVQEEQAIISESVHTAVVRMIGQLEAENEKHDQTTCQVWLNTEIRKKKYYNSDGTKSFDVDIRTYKAEVLQEQFEYGAPKVIEVGRSNRVGFAFEAVVRVKVGGRRRFVEKTIEIADQKIPPGYRDEDPSEPGLRMVDQYAVVEKPHDIPFYGGGATAGMGLSGYLPFWDPKDRPDSPPPVAKALATAAQELDKTPFYDSQAVYRVSLRFSHKDAQWKPFASRGETRELNWFR